MSAKTSPKVGFVSLGCPKNLVDSEIMLGALSRHGYSVTAQKEDADVIVVNTCGFIDTAKRESIDTILEMAELKVRGNCRSLSLRVVSRSGIAARSKRKFPRSILFSVPTNLAVCSRQCSWILRNRRQMFRSTRCTRRRKFQQSLES